MKIALAGAGAVGEKHLDALRLIELGGNIYFLVKLTNTDGWSAQKAVGSMTDLTPDEYAAMMRAGGRSPEGLRSIKANEEKGAR